MMQSAKENMICCIMTVILLFSGMYVETSTIDSSFLRASNEAYSSIRSASYITDEVEPCTTDMLGKGNSVIRLNVNSQITKGQSRVVLIFFVVGLILQYLLYYQSAEKKVEDDILLSHSVAVNYIHLKDGEK